MVLARFPRSFKSLGEVPRRLRGLGMTSKENARKVPTKKALRYADTKRSLEPRGKELMTGGRLLPRSAFASSMKP